MRILIIFLTIGFSVLIMGAFFKMQRQSSTDRQSSSSLPFENSQVRQQIKDSSVNSREVILVRYQNLPPWTTSLVSACGNGDLEAVKVLIARGADVNEIPKGMGYLTPLMWAGDNMEIVDYLLEHGADPNKKDIRGQTALIRAIGMGNTNLVRKLIAKGANVNERDASGKNIALGYAKATQNPSMVELLKQAGATE